MKNNLDPIDEIKKVLNKINSAQVHLDEVNGCLEIKKVFDGFTIRIFGFTNDGYLRAIELARIQEWIPMGNSKFKYGHDAFFICLTKYISALQSEFKLDKFLVDDDERF